MWDIMSWFFLRPLRNRKDRSCISKYYHLCWCVSILEFLHCIWYQRVDIFYEDVWENTIVIGKNNHFGYIFISNGAMFEDFLIYGRKYCPRKDVLDPFVQMLPPRLLFCSVYAVFLDGVLL